MSHVWHKLAALSGASAVGAAAYGAHVLPSQASDPYFERVYERSNTMHLMASALLGIAPIARKPRAVGGLASVGALLFCSSCYSVALTEDRKLGMLAPVGGMMLIGAWASLVL